MYLTKHQSADGPRWALDGGLLPPPDFSMQKGDRVRITIGELVLENVVDPGPRPREA